MSGHVVIFFFSKLCARLSNLELLRLNRNGLKIIHCSSVAHGTSKNLTQVSFHSVGQLSEHGRDHSVWLWLLQRADDTSLAASRIVGVPTSRSFARTCWGVNCSVTMDIVRRLLYFVGKQVCSFSPNNDTVKVSLLYISMNIAIRQPGSHIAIKKNLLFAFNSGLRMPIISL